MREAQNVAEVVRLKPDYLGFIFYPKSPRYVGKSWNRKIIEQVPQGIERVGVFVNESSQNIKAVCTKYGINTLQLHGSETPLFCQKLKDEGYTVFKAFQIGNDTHLEEMVSYCGKCDYFLYDTKSKDWGGSGEKFNWVKLKEINTLGSFLLSGGITVDDAKTIMKLSFSNLKGVDINSKFETEPALKNVELLSAFITEIRK